MIIIEPILDLITVRKEAIIGTVLPSHANDFKVPEVRKYLDLYVRGSNGYGGEDRVKLMS